MPDAIVILGAFAGFSTIGNAILLADRLRGKPDRREITNDPLRVQAAQPFLTAESLEPLEDRLTRAEGHIEDLREKATLDYNKLMESDAAARLRLHTKIDVVVQDVASIKATIEPLKLIASTLSRDIGRLEGILQRQPQS